MKRLLLLATFALFSTFALAQNPVLRSSSSANGIFRAQVIQSNVVRCTVDANLPWTTEYVYATRQLKIVQGTTVCTLPNHKDLTVRFYGMPSPPCTWPAPPTVTPVCPDGQNQVGGTWVHGAVCPTWVYQNGTCPPPPICTNPRPNSTPICESGLNQINGTWTQAPYPNCAWTYANGECPAVDPQPDPNTNIIDLSYVVPSGTAFNRFKTYVDRAVNGSPDYGFSALDAAYMYKITGLAQYATLAVATAERQVADAEARIAANQNPAVAGDSYLEVGQLIGDVAIVYAWCNDRLTAAQKSRWAAYANQAIYNVWHPTTAKWGSRNAPWSGWAINDPANNYYYSFVRATMWWGIASNNQEHIDYLTTNRLPLLTNFYGSIPGGGSLEGTGYGTAHKNLFELYQVWKDSGHGDLGNANSHMKNSALFWTHATVPTLDRFAPFGDQSRVSEPEIYDYQRTLVVQAYHQTTDQAVKQQAGWWLNNIDLRNMSSAFNSRYDLIPIAPTTTPPSALTFRAPEVGAIFSRTGWTESAMWIAVMMGEYNQSHAHQEQGGFTLYRGTWLAVTNNIWSHSGIQQATRDKNIVRFERNGTIVPQRERATSKVVVTNYTTGAGGEFHVTGNITPVYQSGSGVNNWTRTIDFVGGVTTVSDSYQTDSATRGFWQLNVPVEPTINGNVVIAGNLRMTVLEPAAATITKTNMRNIDSDYNKGWRIDVTNGTGSYRVRLEDSTLNRTTPITKGQ